MNLKRNEDNFKMLSYWIDERHKIFLKREAGEEPPWTEDPILQEWKFCNPFRVNDRETRALHTVIKDKGPSVPGDLLFNIFAFRAFNSWEVWKDIGWCTSADQWNTAKARDILLKRVKAGKRITSGAYMIRGYQDEPKWFSIPRVLGEIWDKRHDIVAPIAVHRPRSLLFVWQRLMSQRFWGWGPFTYYQVALDLMATSLLQNPEDLNEWTCLGPGGEKGLALIYPQIKPQLAWPEVMPKLLRDVNVARGGYVPLLNLQDLEFSLCELQKYHRIANGGRGKERYHGRP